MIKQLSIAYDKHSMYEKLLNESNNELENLLNEIKEHNNPLYLALKKDNGISVWSCATALIKDGKIVFQHDAVFKTSIRELNNE